VQHANTLSELVLDRYRLVRRLGSGGFGTVWLAHDERLDREVAVKRIGTASPSEAERARREALAAARLAHPGIVSLYESGADDAAVYLVSELVRGETLDVLEAEGALSDRDVLEIGVVLCEALAHAHARGVVHRDVKPGNVIVPEAPEDGGAAAKLTDFGIARVVGDDALTRTGDVLGTLAYMAPEQAEGRSVSAHSDLYSLGLVLYEALAGVNPVRGASPAETARRLGEPVPSLARSRRDLPRGLCDALDTAVDVDPRARGSVTALRRALSAARAEVSDEPGVVEAPGLATAITRRFRREEWAPPEALPPRERVWPDEPADEDEDEAAERPRLTLPARLCAGLAAAGLAAAALLGFADGAPPVSPAIAAAVVGVAVFLLPRLAWLAGAAALLGWLLVDGQDGTALLVLVAIAPVPILLPRAGVLWSLPALAPLLGLAGLAPVYATAAGLAGRNVARRAALGALGALWLFLAEPLLARHLLAGHAVSGAWGEDGRTAFHDVLVPLLDVHLGAVALVFAVTAGLLPWLVRGRRLAPDLVAATAWAAGLAAGLQAAVAPASARGAIAGAVVAAVAALVARAAGAGPRS
jgi:eukaryotic-like serine/threonine-protein kinase